METISFSFLKTHLSLCAVEVSSEQSPYRQGRPFRLACSMALSDLASAPCWPWQLLHDVQGGDQEREQGQNNSSGDGQLGLQSL